MHKPSKHIKKQIDEKKRVNDIRRKTKTKAPPEVNAAPYNPSINPGVGNTVELEVYGPLALFTDPFMRVGGEKCTYHVPTYEAIKGILESCYWKPTIIWFPDEIRVMNRIQTVPDAVTFRKWAERGNDLAMYSYLKDVRYQVRAHFEWNANYPELACDRNVKKHYEIAARSIAKGGRYDVFLGTRECQAYVEPCKFGEGKGAYDDLSELDMGIMYHGMTYPNEASSEKTAGKLTRNMCKMVMRNGIITFPRPEDCLCHETIRDYPFEEFVTRPQHELDGHEGGAT